MADKQQDQLIFDTSDDFTSAYANNIQFQGTAMDLKMIFGEVDQRDGKGVVDQHTAITIPWTEAKILVYYLQIQIYVQEITHGMKIQVPTIVLPPEPPPVPKEWANDPKAHMIREFVKALRDEFIAANQ